MSEEPSFPGINIIKQLYKTKNSLIYLINDSNSECVQIKTLFLNILHPQLRE